MLYSAIRSEVFHLEVVCGGAFSGTIYARKVTVWQSQQFSFSMSLAAFLKLSP